jgi:hypothetical protein
MVMSAPLVPFDNTTKNPVLKPHGAADCGDGFDRETSITAIVAPLPSRPSKQVMVAVPVATLFTLIPVIQPGPERINVLEPAALPVKWVSVGPGIVGLATSQTGVAKLLAGTRYLKCDVSNAPDTVRRWYT